ncbi:hypothetical protein D3C81_1269100 [compost metagenome]
MQRISCICMIFAWGPAIVKGDQRRPQSIGRNKQGVISCQNIGSINGIMIDCITNRDSLSPFDLKRRNRCPGSGWRNTHRVVCLIDLTEIAIRIHLVPAITGPTGIVIIGRRNPIGLCRQSRILLHDTIQAERVLGSPAGVDVVGLRFVVGHDLPCGS